MAPTPLVIPAKSEDLTSHYDLTISHPAVDQPSLATFERWLADAAALEARRPRVPDAPLPLRAAA